MEGSETEAGRRGHLVPSRHQQLGQTPLHTSLNTTMLLFLLPSLSSRPHSLSLFDRLQCPVLQRWRDSQGVLMVNKESKRFPDSLEKSEGIDGWEECVEREQGAGLGDGGREETLLPFIWALCKQDRRGQPKRPGAASSLQLQSNFNFAHLPHQMH